MLDLIKVQILIGFILASVDPSKCVCIRADAALWDQPGTSLFTTVA